MVPPELQGTDGVFDNLYVEEVPRQLAASWEMYDTALSSLLA